MVEGSRVTSGDPTGTETRELERLQAELRHAESQRALLADRLLAAEQIQALEIVRLRALLEDAELETERLRNQHTALGAELRAAVAADAESRDVVQAMEHSLSWRITAPLRAVRRRLGRG